MIVMFKSLVETRIVVRAYMFYKQTENLSLSLPFPLSISLSLLHTYCMYFPLFISLCFPLSPLSLSRSLSLSVSLSFCNVCVYVCVCVCERERYERSGERRVGK